jgi:hypothetical protein
MKHGVFQRETGRETVYDFFWMGELINEVDFNERLRDQARAIAKDIDSLQMGMDLHEAIVEGEKTETDVRLLELLVEADSHLSCIFHRFGNRLPDDLVKDIGKTVDKIRAVTELKK